MIMCTGWMGIDHFIASTEDCKLAVTCTCKMQNRNATDKLNPQCSKLALFANTITQGSIQDFLLGGGEEHIYRMCRS